MNPRKELSSLPTATTPINASTFKVLGIDPTTGRRAKTAVDTLPLADSSGNASVRQLTQAQYDALTKDPNTFYVVDGGMRIYIGNHRLVSPQPTGTSYTIPSGGGYTDIGLNSNTNKFGWSIRIKTSSDPVFVESQFWRDLDLNPNQGPFTTPAIGDAVDTSSRSTDSRNFLAIGSFFDSINRPYLSLDSSNNVLLGLIGAPAISAKTIEIAEPLVEYIKTDYTSLTTLNIPDGNFVATGITLPDTGVRVQIQYAIGQDTNQLGFTLIEPKFCARILTLPASSAGDESGSDNSIVNSALMQTPTGTTGLAIGISSSNELLFAATAARGFDRQPIVLGSTTLSGYSSYWLARVWRQA